jgi:hypothetical protein
VQWGIFPTGQSVPLIIKDLLECDLLLQTGKETKCPREIMLRLSGWMCMVLGHNAAIRKWVTQLILLPGMGHKTMPLEFIILCDWYEIQIDSKKCASQPKDF